MLIDGFINRKIAISITPDGSIRIPEDLAILEREINDAVGYHVSDRRRLASGFAEYCVKRLEVAKRDYHVEGIEVSFDGSAFGFMQAGTTYYQDEEGMDVIDAAEFLEELTASNLQSAALEEDFFEILN